MSLVLIAKHSSNYEQLSVFSAIKVLQTLLLLLGNGIFSVNCKKFSEKSNWCAKHFIISYDRVLKKLYFTFTEKSVEINWFIDQIQSIIHTRRKMDIEK